MPEKRRPVVAVIDDDAGVRDSLCFLLEASGFGVLVFASAEQYLAATEQQQFTCLLLDHHMPGMTGLDLLQRLRGVGHMPAVAVMTGSPSEQLTRRALELGAVMVLEKPLQEPALFRFLDGAAG